MEQLFRGARSLGGGATRARLVLLTARAKARNPNAAGCWPIMTAEGNKVFDDDPGNATVYDSSKLPKQYVSPKNRRRDQIVKVLGVR